MSCCEEDHDITWIIENYSYCDKRKRTLLLSPRFLTSNMKGHAWRIRLIPSKVEETSEKYVSLVLVTVNGVCTKKTVNMELRIAGNEVIAALDAKMGMHLKSPFGDHYLFQKVLRTVDLEKIMKKSPNDILTVRCRISTANSSTAGKRKKINFIAKTTIVVHKVSYNLNLRYDESSGELAKKIFPIVDFFQFNIIIKAPEDDVLIEIRRIDVRYDRAFKVKCRVLFLDYNDTVLLSKCDFFLFDNNSPEKNIWPFPSFFKKSLLLDGKLNYIFSLKFDFFISNFARVHEYIEKAEDVCHNSCLEASENPVINSLKDDLNAILSNNKHADVKLRVDEEIISAHKVILASRSPVFSAMFDQDMIENQTGEIRISDVDADTMKLFLKFLYTGMLEVLDCEKMLELLLAAEKYQVPSLKEKCSEYLTLQLNVDNVCDVVSIADMVGHRELKAAAIECIKENTAKILGSQNWPKWIKKNVQIGSEILCKLSENFKNVS